jgi:type I restriction enzyme R subunit
MRQAIEEGFILDVLQSYTTYSTYFELIENEKAQPGYEVETAKGRRLLLRHVGKHPHTIESKAKLLLDHFFSKTTHKIGGEAKAMVVTSSRAHAVLYKQTIDRILREDYGGKAQSLVAFSGKVTITGYDKPFTEESMNPADAKDIREAFKKQKYRILIVANKFQTGFDQPLLHTMYVDKKLGGVATVQTLSRLNRKGPPAKLDTMVLDFVNTQTEVEEDFKDYYGKTSLDRGTDPQKLYNLKYEVEGMGLFTQAEVDEFGQLFILKKASGQKLSPLFTKIIRGKYAALSGEEQERFRDVLRRYINQYAFISQIITWIDVELEKFYLFTKLLLKYLPPKKDALPEEILDMVDMDKFRLQEQENGSIVLNPGDTEMENTSADGHKGRKPPERDQLKVVVDELNERFHFDFEDRDRVMKIVLPKLAKDEGLIAAYQTDNLDTLRRQKFSTSLEEALIDSASDFYNVLNRMSEQADFKRLFEEFVLGEFKKGLEAEKKPVSTREEQTHSLTIKAAGKYLSGQLGKDQKWDAVNEAVWQNIYAKPAEIFLLSDIEPIAEAVSCEPDEVLALLALLSRPSAQFLKMEYLADGEQEVEILPDEVGRKVRAWWKEQSLSDEEWRDWASHTRVQWRPVARKEDI